jgi:hypothetical protein
MQFEERTSFVSLAILKQRASDCFINNRVEEALYQRKGRLKIEKRRGERDENKTYAFPILRSNV